MSCPISNPVSYHHKKIVNHVASEISKRIVGGEKVGIDLNPPRSVKQGTPMLTAEEARLKQSPATTGPRKPKPKASPNNSKGTRPSR